MDQPLFDAKPHFNDEEWNRLAEGLNRLGNGPGKGNEGGYHHHMGTGVQTAEEIDRLMEMTDENLVFLPATPTPVSFREDPVEILAILPRSHVHRADVRDSVAVRVKKRK